PEFQMWSYSISRDGKRVLFAAEKETGNPGVWLAALDGSAAPRQFTSDPGISALFGANGDVFYAAREKDAAALYHVKEDGSDLRRVISEPVYFLNAASPDGKYLAVSLPAGGKETGSGATVLYPVDGGNPIT